MSDGRWWLNASWGIGKAWQAEKHDTKVIINNIAAKNGGDEMDELYYYYYYYSSESQHQAPA